MPEENEGDRGVKFVPPGEGKALWALGGMVTFYATGEETKGAFSLFEESTAPQSGAPPHLHHEEDQALFILDGEHEFLADGQTFPAGVGAFIYVPRGTVHSFANVGTTPGRVLVLSTPAGGTEQLFFEVGVPVTDRSSPPPDAGPPDLGSLKALAQKHGSDIDMLALLQQASVTPPSEQDA